MTDENLIYGAAQMIAEAIRQKGHYLAQVEAERNGKYLIRVTGRLSGPFAFSPERFDLGISIDAEVIRFEALRPDDRPRDDKGNFLIPWLRPATRRQHPLKMGMLKSEISSEFGDAIETLERAVLALRECEWLVELCETRLLQLIKQQLPGPIRVMENGRFLVQLRKALEGLGLKKLPPAKQWCV
jgi:hypothetical protein